LNGKIRIGIIGCGAVTEIGHLPAVAANPNCTLTALVDRNQSRLELLAKRGRPEFTSEDYRDCFGKIDAAILALPHNLHAPVAIDLLSNGIDVLVDKPMAMSASECDAMMEAAKSGNRMLAVGLMRRNLYSAQMARSFIESGMLGAIRSFHFAEGGIYNWPVTSDFFFKRQTAGGGVLLDTGAHTLDLLLWWLGDVASFEYFDDTVAENGVEADCLMRLTMKSGAEGTVELSRTRNLRNTAIIVGENADMEVDLRKNWLTVYPKNGPVICKGNLCLKPEVENLDGHRAHNGGAKIALAGPGLVGSHAIECIAEDGRSAGHVFGTRDCEVTMPVQPLSDYTAHVYLKGIAGDFADVPLMLRIGNADFQFIKSTIINLTGEWRRYSISFTTGEADDGVSLAVWKKDDPAPIRWLADGFQLEAGPGGGYYGPPRAPIVLDSVGPQGPQAFASLFHDQIADFAGAILSGRQPIATGAEGRKSVALIEELYRDSERLNFEWQEKRIFA